MICMDDLGDFATALYKHLTMVDFIHTHALNKLWCANIFQIFCYSSVSNYTILVTFKNTNLLVSWR